MAHALLDRAAKNGARLICGSKVQHLIRTGDRIIGVQTALGPLIADHVICAAGAWSETLLAKSGISLPGHAKLKTQFNRFTPSSGQPV